MNTCIRKILVGFLVVCSVGFLAGVVWWLVSHSHVALVVCSFITRVILAAIGLGTLTALCYAIGSCLVGDEQSGDEKKKTMGARGVDFVEGKKEGEEQHEPTDSCREVCLSGQGG